MDTLFNQIKDVVGFKTWEYILNQMEVVTGFYRLCCLVLGMIEERCVTDHKAWEIPMYSQSRRERKDKTRKWDVLQTTKHGRFQCIVSPGEKYIKDKTRKWDDSQFELHVEYFPQFELKYIVVSSIRATFEEKKKTLNKLII